MFTFGKLIGLTIVAIKGEYNSKGKSIEPAYILFSDGKTVLTLEEQDYYSYHDCSTSARYMNVYVAGENGTHENYYNHIMSYPDATVDI